MTEDKPVAWEVEFGNGEVELWSVKDHSSEPAFGETVTALYSKSPSAVRTAAIAEAAKLVDHILREGGGTYGDAIRALSPRPTVSEAWISKLAGEHDENAIVATLAALGYEVTP